MNQVKKLGVNIDHIATLRNARGSSHPNLITLTEIAIESGADFITAHLREDRRHVNEMDLINLKKKIKAPINLEIAATNEMIDFAISLMPYSVCFVPEKRQEVTTESGLDAKGLEIYLDAAANRLKKAGILTTLFVDPEVTQVEAAFKIGASGIELHTGRYCDKRSGQELKRLEFAAKHAEKAKLECHAGHGLTYETIIEINSIKEISAINIGHFVVSQALEDGLANVVSKIKSILNTNT